MLVCSLRIGGLHLVGQREVFGLSDKYLPHSRLAPQDIGNGQGIDVQDQGKANAEKRADELCPALAPATDPVHRVVEPGFYVGASGCQDILSLCRIELVHQAISLIGLNPGAVSDSWPFPSPLVSKMRLHCDADN